MDDSQSQARYRSLWEDSGLWSCLGYEGLSIAFDIPVTNIQSLPEEQLQALMRLLFRLSKPEDEAFRNRVQAAESMNAEERLKTLVDLSSQCGA